jgi:hypothetical protein
MRTDDGVRHFIQETLDLSVPVAEVHDRLPEEQWSAVEARIAELAHPFASADGRLAFPAVSLGASASS